MKKYSLGSIAVLLAICFSAFTKPTDELDFKDFKFDAVIPTSVNVVNPLKWHSSTSITCSQIQALTQACKIEHVSEIYYHLVSGTNYVLNDQTFMNTNRLGTVDEDDVLMSITASDGTVTGDGEFLVSSASSGNITNSDDN